MSKSTIRSEHIVSIDVNAMDYETGVEYVVDRLRFGKGGYTCLANVHMVMEAHDDPTFAGVVNGASLVASDGMPLLWMLRRLGHAYAKRVYGPTFTLHLCARAEEEDLPIALYGGTEESLASFQTFLKASYPSLQVACAISPPFRKLSEEEDASFTKQIRDSGARMVFVGIGCPKQERWMAEHTGRLPGAMLFGVGAAFDFHSGRVRQAPDFLQKLGLEWAFRLAVEPRRLWRRYVVLNPRFMVLAMVQLLTRARDELSPRANRRLA